jgi:hypothetical protein
MPKMGLLQQARMREMLVRKIEKSIYHCSFCAKYPELIEQGIKKVYIFDDFYTINTNNTSYIGYYQCIDMDTNYA